MIVSCHSQLRADLTNSQFGAHTSFWPGLLQYCNVAIVVVVVVVMAGKFAAVTPCFISTI